MQSLLMKPLAEVTLNDLSTDLQQFGPLKTEEAEGLNHATLSAEPLAQQVSCQASLDKGDCLSSLQEIVLMLSLSPLGDQSSDHSLDNLGC